jgi:16S rRNA G966 N2-methylase RsmD
MQRIDKINQFIADHRDDDICSLRLKFHGDELAEAAISQIELRRKAATKFVDTSGVNIAPTWLFSPVSVEQATSAAIAAFHARLAIGAHSVLDMTMGMGSDCSAIARSVACDVIAIERNHDLADMSRINYADLPNLEIIDCDSVEYLTTCKRKFDLIFIDPARRDTAGRRVYNIHDCTPDVAELQTLIFEHSPRALVKLSPMLDLSQTLIDLPSTRTIYVVEEKGDCRELLVDMVADFNGTTEIVIVDGGNEMMRFTLDDEDGADVTYSTPTAGDFLYEPSPAAMKAGGFKLMASRYQLSKLAANSHLYFGKTTVEGFPGRVYQIVEVLPYASSVLKRFGQRINRCEIAVRNFPIKAEELRRKLKVKDGGDHRLMATTAADGSKLLLLLKHTSH